MIKPIDLIKISCKIGGKWEVENVFVANNKSSRNSLIDFPFKGLKCPLTFTYCDENELGNCTEQSRVLPESPL